MNSKHDIGEEEAINMQIEHVNPTVGLGHLESARDAMNAAYNAIALNRGTVGELAAGVPLAREYVSEARDTVAAAEGHEAVDDAHRAAREVLPRLEHAVQLLDALGIQPDPEHVTPLLDEIGIAMDRVEAVLAGAGWD